MSEVESFEEFKNNLEADNSTEPATTAITEPKTVDTAVETVEDNSDTEVKAPEKDVASEYEKQKKSYEELQSVFGRQGKELGDLRKFKTEFEPYLEYLKQMEQQQKQAKYETDPDSKYKDMIEAELAPFRQMKVEQEAGSTVGILQEELGEQYETLAPVMANVLRYYQDNEPDVAEYLAKNPIALVRQAAGDFYLHQQMQNRQNPQAAQVNPQAGQARQRQAQSMAGTAKSKVQGKSTQGDMSSMNINEMRDHLRKMGVAQRFE